MRKNGSNQITNIIQFSLGAVDVKKVSPVGEFINYNPDADRVLRTHWDEPPDPSSVFTKMVPCPPCVWG